LDFREAVLRIDCLSPRYATVDRWSSVLSAPSFDIIERFHGSLANKSDLTIRTHGVATRFRSGGQPFSQKRERRLNHREFAPSLQHVVSVVDRLCIGRLVGPVVLGLLPQGEISWIPELYDLRTIRFQVPRTLIRTSRPALRN
jgi:hypothetical protein